MNTPFKISEDQNTITHESGLVTKFVRDNSDDCNNCVYWEYSICHKIPCTSKTANKKHITRKDKKTVIS